MEGHRLIVGLGNPGRKYELTRHNLGFRVVDHLAVRYRIRLRRTLTPPACRGRGRIKGQDSTLVKPLTYMNNSGTAVSRIIRRGHFALDNCLIISDDFQLPFGQMRFRGEGSSGGHNGLQSVIDHLGTRDFARLRVGIGPVEDEDIADFVLREFSLTEKKQLEGIIRRAAEGCLAWLHEGMTKAMNQFNQRKEGQ